MALSLALAVPLEGTAQVPADLARGYLVSRQLAGGALPGAPIVDTALAAQVLEGAPREAALYALALSRPDNAEAGLARLLALLGTPYLDPVEKELWRQVVARGELGLAPGAMGVDGIVLARALSLAARDPDWAALLPYLLAQVTAQLAPGGGGWADNGSDPTVVAELAASLAELGAAGDAPRLAALSVLVPLASAGSASWPAAEVALAVRAAAGSASFAQSLLAHLQSLQGGDGSFDGGEVRGTALAALALRRALPDLALSLPGTLDRAPVTGQLYAFQARVENRGLSASPPAQLEATVLDGAGSVVHRAAVAVPGLLPGSIASVAVDLGVQGAPGPRSAILAVNPALAFSEASTDDNLVRLTYQVADLPDLVVEPLDISLSPSPATLYETSAVTVRVRNQGAGVAPAVRAQLFLGSPAAGGTLLAEQVFYNLAPGVPRLLRGAVTPGSLASIDLHVRLDPENAVPEAREDNNQAVVTLTPVDPTALTVDARAEIASNATSPAPLGSKVTLSTWVRVSARRFGSEYALAQVPVDVSVTVTPPGGGPLEVVRTTVDPKPAYSCSALVCVLGGLVAGPISYALPVDAREGTYVATAVVDPLHLIPDIDRTNNMASATVQVVANDAAELWIDPASVAVAPRLVIQGRDSVLTARIGNSGRRDAALVRVDAQLIGANGTATRTTTIPLLRPGESQDVSFSLTYDDARLASYADIIVDPLGEIPETTRTNNQAGTLLHTAAADVGVRYAGQRPDPVPAGTVALVDFDLENTGPIASGAQTLAVTGLWPNPSTPVSSLAPGEVRRVAVALPTAAFVGDKALTAQLGSTSLPFTLRVQNADFRVSGAGIALLPERAPPGTPVRARIAVDNLGPLGATTSVRLYRGYPEGGDLAASGAVFVPGGGAAFFDTDPFPAPGGPPYVVTAVLDEEGAVPEKDEINNSAARATLKAFGETVVAFDETHLPGSTVALNEDGQVGGSAGGLTEYVSDLRARGYTVTTLDPSDAGLTPSLLPGVDVLVGLAPTREYRPDELQAVHDFVSRGGGLFFLADWGNQGAVPLGGGTGELAWAAPVRQMCSALGIRWVEKLVFSGGACSAPSQWFERRLGAVLPHSITSGVDLLLALWPGGFESLPAGAVELVKSQATWQEPNVTVAAAFPLGQGRVVVHGDSSAFDADFSGPSTCDKGYAAYREANNRRFGLQAIDWLADRGSEATFGPDLAFVPARIDASATDVVEGGVVSLALKVRNVGGADMQATTARLYDGASRSRFLHEWSLPPLGVDQEIELSTTWDTTAQAGAHLLSVALDPDGLVTEFNEVNNELALAIAVRSRADLRVDPTDVAVVEGATPVVRMRVHNLGMEQVPEGGSVELATADGAGELPLLRAALPPVPARGAVTLQLPWPGAFPQAAFSLRVAVRVPGGIVESDPTNDATAIRFEPPRLEIQAPLAGTSWGGVKSLRWTARSATRPNLAVHAAVGTPGGAMTGVGSGAEGLDIDTRSFADGEYVLRVTAEDGLQAATREVPFRIDNAAVAVRSFGPGAGTASSTVPAAGGVTSIAIPAGSRVTSASLLLDAAGAPLSTISPTAAYDYSGGSLIAFRGRLHYIYLRSNQVIRQISADEGATWSAAEAVSPAGVSAKQAAANARGIHLVYQLSPSTLHYVRSADGIAFEPPVAIGSGAGNWKLRASEDGLAIVGSSVAWAGPDGQGWTPLASLGDLAAAYADALVARGRLHLVHGGGTGPLYYRSIRVGEQAASLLAAPAVLLSEASSVSPRAMAATAEDLLVAYDYYVPLMELRVQRCPLSGDCSQRDAWLPEPFVLAPAGMTMQSSTMVARPDGALQALWSIPAAQQTTAWRTAASLDAGRAWTPSAPVPVAAMQEGAWLASEDFVARAGRASALELTRWPMLRPRDQAIDVGGDGSVEASRAGMRPEPAQLGDLAEAMNAYLATHADGDDGVVDGVIAVPIAVGGGGAGSTVLRNLEVRHRPASAFAGLADPPLFSPGSSPGVLDSTVLSVLAPGGIAVLSPAGTVLRTLAPAAAGGRYAASFDGRTESGAIFPSGLYAFGSAGSPVGAFEIDDVAPTAALEASAEGLHGGVVELRGTASDADWAGSAKNFAGYRLEYTTDGSSWRTIAAGSAPVAGGILGRWDTSQVGAASATLRLTVRDRAGNATVDARTVGVSPGAPMPPVITAPTVAGTPMDLVGSTVAIGGTAEPGTTVAVYRDGVPVGTTASDGRWALAGVSLPSGVSRFTASATRGSLESARSQAVLVGQFALALSISAPDHVLAGAAFPATVSVLRTSALPGPLRVRLTALDSTGRAAPFTLTPREVTLTFPASGSSSFDASVDPGPAVPGSYTLRAEVVSASLLPAVAEAPVTLDSAVQLQAGLVSDRETYDAMQLVSLTGRVANAGTGISGALAAAITVSDPTGQTTTLGPVAVAPLAPSTSTVLSALYGFPPLRAGAYLATLEVRDELGAVVATSQTAFLVRPAAGAGGLLGTLLVNPATYLPGDQLQTSFTVTNRGEAASVPVSVLLLSQATSAVVARWDGTMLLPASGQANDSASLSTSSADGDALIAVLLGDGRALAAQAVEPVPFQDTAPPVITITGVTEGECRSGPVTPVITISDESPITSSITLDNLPYASGTPVTAEGDYRLRVEATDAAGNAATPVEVAFAIDRTPPVISVAGVADGMLVNRAVTPVVSIAELHPGTTQAFLDAASWPGGTISAEGVHQLRVESVDAAGNPATPLVLTFTIDTTPPQIAVSGVTDGQVTRDALIPVVTVTELHPGSADIRLDGLPFASGAPVTGEGDHLLTAAATDAAGNPAIPVQVRFARDTVAPVVTITGVADGGVYASEVTPGWTVSDSHPGPVAALLDGQPFVAATPVGAAGSHTLTVTATDLAGNGTTRSAAFQIQGVQASVTATIDSGSPRVLAVVNCAGKPASCADSQALVLKAALATGGIPYDIALDGPTFLAKLRENRHNVRVVYRAGSSATNAYWELRELTFEGGGLVVVNDASPDSDPKLIDTLGTAMGGKITSVGTVTISAGDLGPARTLSVAGSGIAQTLKASTALAVGKASKGTVVTTNRYGRGRAVTLTLNPEANVNAAMKDLLVQAVRFAAGGAAVAGVPGAPQYVRLESSLASPTGPLDFRLDAWTATGLTPLSDAGLPVVPPRTWSFPLASSAKETRSFGVVSDQAGTYPVLGELTLLTGGPRLVAQGSVDVVVVGSIAELKQAAIAAAQAIPAGLNDTAKSAAIAHLNAVNPAPGTKAACASSIDQALQATDDLKLIAGTAAADARVKADQLLRALQALHATLP